MSFVSFIICFILPAQVGGLPAPQAGDMQLMPSLVYGQIFVMHNGENWLQGRQCQHPGTVQEESELQERGEAACPTSSWRRRRWPAWRTTSSWRWERGGWWCARLAGGGHPGAGHWLCDNREGKQGCEGREGKEGARGLVGRYNTLCCQCCRDLEE